MKVKLLIACAALGLVGCAHERGGVGTPYDTEYGQAGMSPTLDSYESIYPVRKQPSPNGNDMGGVRPMIDPAREYDYWSDDLRPRSYDRDYPPRAVAPRDTIPFR